MISRDSNICRPAYKDCRHSAGSETAWKQSLRKGNTWNDNDETNLVTDRAPREVLEIGPGEGVTSAHVHSANSYSKPSSLQQCSELCTRTTYAEVDACLVKQHSAAVHFYPTPSELRIARYQEIGMRREAKGTGSGSRPMTVLNLRVSYAPTQIQPTIL